jgi:hypothetical protein
MAVWSEKDDNRGARHDELEPEFFKHRRKTESDQFRLQVDRQTKASYTTREAPAEAGLAIKRHPYPPSRSA